MGSSAQESAPWGWEQLPGAAEGLCCPTCICPCMVGGRGCDQGHPVRRWQRGDVPRATLPHSLLFLPHSLPSCTTRCTLAAPNPPRLPPVTLPHTPQLSPLMWGQDQPPPMAGAVRSYGALGGPGGGQQQGPHEPEHPPHSQPLLCLGFPQSSAPPAPVSARAAGAGDGAINYVN